MQLAEYIAMIECTGNPRLNLIPLCKSGMGKADTVAPVAECYHAGDLR